MSRAAVLFAQGLEECEGLIVVDLLRRAKIETDIVSLDGREEIISSHNVSIRADCSFDHTDFGQYDVIVLPGGMPGTRNLQQDSRVLSVISDFYQKGKLIAAICAAPVILETAGILSGKEATVHHKFTEELICQSRSGFRRKYHYCLGTWCCDSVWPVHCGKMLRPT